MRRSASVVLLVCVLVACDGGGEEAATTTTGQETTTTVENTTTTVAPDPFAVPADPADIDEAYVEAVLAELERINGDALRLAISDGFSPTIRELIESINTSEQSIDEIQTLVDAAGEGFAGFASPPGDIVIAVDSILVASSSCIAADVTQDYTPRGEGALSDARTRVELVRSEGSNATPWVYALRHPLDAGQAPPEPCADS